jgi:apolipoprotein N-acyltransferase
LPLICFDTAYINNYIHKVKKSTIVINVSNDSWFGESSGPHQHFQIVRSRAKEINRWILRSTTSGISGFIDNKGTIVDKIGVNEQGIISYSVPQIENNSIFVNFGYDLMRYLIIFCTFFIIILFLRTVINENS